MLLEAGGIDGSWGNGGIAGAERRNGVEYAHAEEHG